MILDKSTRSGDLFCKSVAKVLQTISKHNIGMYTDLLAKRYCKMLHVYLSEILEQFQSMT
jgi:hypothetical protein